MAVEFESSHQYSVLFILFFYFLSDSKWQSGKMVSDMKADVSHWISSILTERDVNPVWRWEMSFRIRDSDINYV